MGGLRRHPLYGINSAPRPVISAPPGVRLLTNTCIGHGFKMLGKGDRLVKMLPLSEPTDGYDFDTIIVNPDD